MLRGDGDVESIAGSYLDATSSSATRRYIPQSRVGGDATNRWGTYQAEINQVELLGVDDTQPSFFKTGDLLRVRSHYRTHTRIDTPTFGLAFHRSDGVHVNGPNSIREGYEIPYIDGTGYVDYLIEHLPLNQGRYDLTVAIYDRDSTMPHDHHHRLYPLEVHSPTVWHEDGVVHIPAQWQHCSQGGERTAVADGV